MSRGSPLARFDVAFSRELLRWFADLPMPERLEVMTAKHRRFQDIRRRFPRLPPQEADMAALLEVCEQWSLEAEAFASSRALPPDALARLGRRRQAWARSLSGRHSAVKSWLSRNWGKVVDLKNTGASFRVIARCLEEENHVRISHATLWHYWRQWENQN